MVSFFPDYGDIRRSADSHSHARLSEERAEGVLRRKVIGQLANDILSTLAFWESYGRFRGEFWGKARISHTGMHNSDV